MPKKWDHFHAVYVTAEGQRVNLEGGLSPRDDQTVHEMMAKLNAGGITLEEYNDWVTSFQEEICKGWGMPNGSHVESFSVSG